MVPLTLGQRKSPATRTSHRESMGDRRPTGRSNWRWDVHAAGLMVVRMVDGAKPQPPQKMTPPRFLEWVVKQKSQAQEVISC